MKTVTEFEQMSLEDRNSYLLGLDLVTPFKSNFCRYTIKNIKTMQIEATNLALNEVKLKGLTFLKDMKVQQHTYVVERTIDTDTFNKIEQEYDAEMKRRDELFHNYLKESNAVNNDAMHKAIYSKAYDDGHSSGYHEIECNYSELVDFANEVIKLSKGA